MSGFKPLQLVSFVTPETGTHLPSHMISIQPSEAGSVFPFYRKGNHRILKWLPRDSMLHCGKATAQFLDSPRACTTERCLCVPKRKDLQSCHGNPASVLVSKLEWYSEGSSCLQLLSASFPIFTARPAPSPWTSPSFPVVAV